MMRYDVREQWIRNRIYMKNYQHMKADKCSNQIISDVEPKQEDVQLSDNWECNLYNDGSKGTNWFVEIYEKSTEREFTIYITLQ